MAVEEVVRSVYPRLTRREAMESLGTTKIKRVGQYVYEEVLPRLKRLAGRAKYQAMYSHDVARRATRPVELPTPQATWDVEGEGQKRGKPISVSSRAWRDGAWHTGRAPARVMCLRGSHTEIAPEHGSYGSHLTATAGPRLPA